MYELKNNILFKDSYEHFLQLVKTLNKDYMFKVGLGRFMGVQAKLALNFITFK
jgi:hypothetical protein